MTTPDRFDEMAREIVNDSLESVGGGFLDVMLRGRFADALRSAYHDGAKYVNTFTVMTRPPAGHVLDDAGVVRPFIQVWHCSYCGTCYAEYCNGCPRCHLGEQGTATSLRVRWLIDPVAEAAAKGQQKGGAA